MENLFDIALSFATEDQNLVDKVYHYLKVQGLSVFYAPAPECQVILSGENQREIFYCVFGLESEYVVLFVSQYYISKSVPMEEAEIAFSTHGKEGKVIPIYIDGTSLPQSIFDNKDMNYFSSDNAATIATHIATKIKKVKKNINAKKDKSDFSLNNQMNIKDNTGGIQIFIQN